MAEVIIYVYRFFVPRLICYVTKVTVEVGGMRELHVSVMGDS
jgi:hypothetical protein